MAGISYQTYQELGEGVRYYNMNLGHQATEFDALPSLNPFQGLSHDDVDETILSSLETHLEDAITTLSTESFDRISTACEVSEQNIKYAYDGLKKARIALYQAQQELD